MEIEILLPLERKWHIPKIVDTVLCEADHGVVQACTEFCKMPQIRMKVLVQFPVKVCGEIGEGTESVFAFHLVMCFRIGITNIFVQIFVQDGIKLHL
jgi:hypothetical protein